MTAKYVMGLDLGSSGVRSLLVNVENGNLYSGTRSWVFPTAEGTFGIGQNLELEKMWAAIGEASREALAQASNGEGIEVAVASIAVSAIRFGTIVLDADGEALFAVPNRDARAAGECFELADKLGDKILAKTGMWPLPIHTSARLLWLKKQNEQLLAKARCVLSVSDWVNYKLCGERATDYSQAGCTGLFNLQDKIWDGELLEASGVPASILPPLMNAGEKLGTLSDAAAQVLGMANANDIVIGMGGGDSQISLLGAGAIRTGDVAIVTGTTTPVQSVSDTPLIDAQGRMWSGFHVMPDSWVIESSGGPTGECLSWMARLLFPDAPEPEALLLAHASNAEPGAQGLLSNFGAEIMNGKAPAMPVGQMTLTHMSTQQDEDPRRHFARAVIEGQLCSIRGNIEQLAEITQTDRPRLILCGGISRSDIFSQLLADVCASDIERACHYQTGAVGAAICAAVATGLFSSLHNGVSTLTQRIADCQTGACGFAPQQNTQAANQKLYADWQAMREVAKDTTATQAANHVLPWVVKDDGPQSAKANPIDKRPSILVSASFDEQSIAKMMHLGELEYASFRDVKRLLTGPSLVAALRGKDIFVTEVDIVDADALKNLPDLRVVAACRGDAVNVDVDACTAFGIPVLFAPGRNAVAVADLTVAFMLQLARKLPVATGFLSDPSCTAGDMGKMGQAFGQLQGNELWQKTVGLVGMGAVGRAVAKRLKGFDVRLLVADPFVSAEQALLAGCELVSLDRLLCESDFVSMHAAVTPETQHMMAADQFALMKAGAFFINTARAALVDEEALCAALEQGAIAGAALDTFSVEPPGFDHPLVQNAKVISTPHVAGNTQEVANHQGQSITQAVEQLLRGEKPDCVLNPQVLDSFDWQQPRRQPSDAELVALQDKPGPAVSDLQRDAKAKKEETVARSSAVPSAIYDAMAAVLQAFCDAMSGDQAVIDFSADKDVTLHFAATDLGLDFYIKLDGGKVVCALGNVEGGASVNLSMRAVILDGMFAGTVNATDCAMNGDISFTGDAGKAMTIQHLQADMERLYVGVIEQLGRPDLDSIAKVDAAGDAGVAVANDDIRQDLVDTVKELFAAQLITATGGNVSVRIPDTEDEVWITPSQLFKGDLRPEVLVRINLDGDSLDPGARSPSSEWSIHTQILKRRSEARAVVHAHAANATILANAGLPFLPISTEAAFFGDIPRVPFIMPGTQALADAVGDAIEGEWAVLMINHGLIVCGRSLRRAADMVEIIERSAEVMLGCYALGKEPPTLPDDVIEDLRRMGDMIA